MIRELLGTRFYETFDADHAPDRLFFSVATAFEPPDHLGITGQISIRGRNHAQTFCILLLSKPNGVVTAVKGRSSSVL